MSRASPQIAAVVVIVISSSLHRSILSCMHALGLYHGKWLDAFVTVLPHFWNRQLICSNTVYSWYSTSKQYARRSTCFERGHHDFRSVTGLSA